MTAAVDVPAAPRAGAHRGRALPLVSAGLITVFVYAIFIGGSHPGVSLTETRMLSGLIAFVVLLGWVAVAFVDPWWRPRSAVLLPIALAFLAFCLASLFSQNPRLSQDAVLQAAGFVLAFLLLSRLAAHPFFRPRLITIVVGITLVITFAYAIQVLVAWGVWWTSIGRFAAPPLRPAPEVVSVVSPVLGAAITRLDLGLVNLTAGLCLLALPFAIAVVAARSRTLAVLVAAVGLFVLVTSASRGALLGVAFAVAAGIALTAAAFAMDADRHRGLRRRVGRSAIAGGIAVVLVSVGLMGALLPAMVGRFAVGIDQARLSLYESTIRLISAHPILGTGPGTWSILHSGATSAGARNIVQDHAHDTYLQTLSDVGIVGGLACAVIVIAVAIQLLRRFRAATGSERMVIGAILIGLAGASGHAIADHFLNLGTYCLILAALVAIGIEDARGYDAGRRRGIRSSGRVGAAILVAVVASFLLAAPTVLGHVRAELLAADANAAANAGDWVAAERSAREAAALDPGFPLYRIELGAALANLGRPEARAVVEQVAAEDPLPHLQLSAAALALADGDTNAALDAVTLAESRSTGEVIIDLNAAKVALAAGRRDLAVQWLAAAFSLNVELAGSDYFDDPAWSGIVESAVEIATDRFTEAGDETSPAVLSAFDGNAGIAEATLRAMAPSTRRDVALARVLWLMDRHPEAIALLEEAAASDNLAPDPYVYLVRYCTEARDEACVRHYRPLGLLAPEGQYVSAPNDGSTIPAPLNQRWRGLPAIYPAAVYLQEGNNDMLAPGVVVVGTP